MAGLHYNPVASGSGTEISLDRSEAQEKSNPSLCFDVLVALGLALAYFLAGKAGLIFASIHPSASAVWPPTGIALAACLIFGYRVWPGIFLGALFVNATTAGSIATSVGIATGNTLEALLGSYLVIQFANGVSAFNRPRDVVKFTVLAAGAAAALSATTGVLSLSLGDYASWNHFGSIWFTWWLGDAAGAMVVTPLLLSWWIHPGLDWDRAQLYEAGLLLASLLIVGGLVFGNVLPGDIQQRPIAFLCIPFLIWAAFRFGPRGAATAGFVLSAAAIVGTIRGFGPFAWHVTNDALLLLLAFLGVLDLTALSIAAGMEERRRAEEARAGLAAIVDSSDDAIIGKNLDGRITSWNASAQRMFGYTAAQAVGQPISIIIPPERMTEEARALERLGRTGAIELAETVRVRKDGRRLDISLALSPIKDARGRIVGASSIARDISEHKRIIEALRASEEKFHQMADTVPDILFTSDSQGVIEYTNQRFYEVTGVAQGAAEQFNWASAIHPDDAQVAAEEWPRLVAKGEPFRIEFRLRVADGSYRWIMSRANPIRDRHGRVVKWFGSCTDIDEQKRAQEEREKLLAAEQIERIEAEAAASKLQRLQAVTDSTVPELTLPQMLNGLLGRLRSALQADSATVLLFEPGGHELLPVASVGLEEEVEAGIRTPLGVGAAGRIAASDGGIIFNDLDGVETANSLMRRRLTAIVGAPLKIESTVIGVIHAGSARPRNFAEEHLDLIRLVADRAALAIERTRLHENERAARAAAEDANRAKDEFLAMLGHELRNPLGAIVSSMEILEHFGADESRAAKAREIMGRQLKHLARLVNDLLDVARVTKGKIELHREPLDLSQSVQACINGLGDRLANHAVKMELEPVWVDADPTRLEQIVTNLLRNAVEFTPADGRILVSVTAADGGAVLRVEDNGAGIPAQLLPRIFDLFVQDERGLDRSGGGLGIGLTLTKRLVELHGGTVGAASPGPGLGSTFTVRLPRLPQAGLRPQSGQTPATAPIRHRILIVEDHADSRESLRAILESSGHEIYEAADGAGGIEQALAHQPDVALIDIGLPGVDGYEVCRRIRSGPAGPEVFLIALTGYGQPGDRLRAREAGFDAHLVKPVDFARLSEIIAAAPECCPAQPGAAPA